MRAKDIQHVSVTQKEIYTDHKVLEWLKSIKDPIGRLGNYRNMITILNTRQAQITKMQKP